MKAKAEAQAIIISVSSDNFVLTIENCMTFNVEGSDFYDEAVELAGFAMVSEQFRFSSSRI